LAVELNAGASCSRFAGRILRGLSTGARTPLWMRERLRRAGLRPIQPIVDVTNYVILELGPDVLVIADGRGAVGLAGIMGGQSTAVSDATTDVFLEGAFFAPNAIA